MADAAESGGRSPRQRTPLTSSRRAEHERLVEHAAHPALDLQLGLEVGHAAGVVDHDAAQHLRDEQPHEPAVELAAGDRRSSSSASAAVIGILYESGAVRTS